MFQFTTTNVINSDKDLTTGKDLYTVEDTTLVIKRVANFKKENISAIYKAAAQEAENAKVTIDLSGISATENDVLRLNIYIGLTQASQDSRYSNDMIYKGKPFSVDFVWKGAEDTAKNLVKTIKKYDVLVYGEKLLNVSSSGHCITIEATNEYQRFRKVDIDKYEKSTTEYPYSGTYTTLKNLDSIDEKDSNAEVTATEEGYFAGKEGFGTYSFLLHNLRLPTSARTRAFGINQDETPIVGATYDQYTIHYCADRGPLGLNAVGDTVKSTTTHVFYVLSTLSDAFLKVLQKVGSVKDAKTGEVISASTGD